MSKPTGFLSRLQRSRAGASLLEAIEQEEDAARVAARQKAATAKVAAIEASATEVARLSEAAAALRTPALEAEAAYRAAKLALDVATAAVSATSYAYERQIAGFDAELERTADPALVAALESITLVARDHQAPHWRHPDGAAALAAARTLRERARAALVDPAADGATVAAELLEELQGILSAVGASTLRRSA